MARQADRRINLAVARAIPVVILGIIIYACYVVTKPLCIDYLISPLPEYARSSRVGAGAAIIAVFYVLLIVVLITYARLLYNVVWNPDLLPKSSAASTEQQSTEPSTRQSYDRPRKKGKGHRKSRGTETSEKPATDVERALGYNAQPMVLPWDTAGLENFYKKDVFVCQPDGRPLFCSKCCHFKPDRTHHCREVDRCVRKMDHFCPWVGGVVSEKSFKFFIQFVFYTAVFCAFVLIVCAIFTADLRRETGDVNPHWAIGIGLSGFFGLFAFGMTISSLQLAAMNLTTIENLSRRSVVWTLAIRVPNHVLRRLQPGSRWAPTFRTITYPLPSMPSSPPPPNPNRAPEDGARESIQPPPIPPPLPSNSQQTTPPSEQHVFAILQTLPGENPFDLGSPLKNIQQVLGYSVIDWFLPLKRGPCADHSGTESEFAMGPVISRLKREAGLESASEPQPINSNHNHDPHDASVDPTADATPDELPEHKHKRKRRRGKHSHHHHHQQQQQRQHT